MKKQHKKILKTLMYLKGIFTIYLILSLSIIPNINSVNAKIIQGAHRGASLDYEENTIEAFKYALKNEKYKFIEFDIQYSKDEKIVVFHENNMFMIPKKFVSIPDLTYDELNSRFEFEVPLYGDVMDVIDGKKPVDIEIKSYGNFEQDTKLIEFIIQDCKERGISSQVMISSLSKEIIDYIEENYPETRTGKVYWITIESIMPISSICDDVYDTSADYILLHGYNLHNYDTLVECKPEGKNLIFWYFTDEVYIINEENDCIFWESC